MPDKKTDNLQLPTRVVRVAERPRNAVRPNSRIGIALGIGRIHAETRLERARIEFLVALRDVELAERDLADAVALRFEAEVGREQAIALLEDLPTVLAGDRDARLNQRLKLRQEREKTEYELRLAGINQEMEIEAAEAAHEAQRRRLAIEAETTETGKKATANQAAPQVDQPFTAAPSGKSQAQQEFEKNREKAFSADQARFDTEIQIAQMIERAGGKEKLTPEQLTLIENLRAKLELLIRESGLT